MLNNGDGVKVVTMGHVLVEIERFNRESERVDD